MSGRSIVVVPVTETAEVDHRFGKAPQVAVVVVEDGAITDWTEYSVGWDVLHDEGEHGTHHARIVRFMHEHEVTDAVAAHMGPPMQNTLGKLGVRLHLDLDGDARKAVLAAVA